MTGDCRHYRSSNGDDKIIGRLVLGNLSRYDALEMTACQLNLKWWSY